jgi:hypothetical protein
MLRAVHAKIPLRLVSCSIRQDIQIDVMLCNIAKCRQRRRTLFEQNSSVVFFFFSFVGALAENNQARSKSGLLELIHALGEVRRRNEGLAEGRCTLYRQGLAKVTAAGVWCVQEFGGNVAKHLTLPS